MRERKLSSNNFVSDVCRLARLSECLSRGVHRVKIGFSRVKSENCFHKTKLFDKSWN